MKLIFNPPIFDGSTESSIMLTHKKTEKHLVFSNLLKKSDVSDDTLYNFIKSHDFSRNGKNNDIINDPIILARIFRIMSKYNMRINYILHFNIIFHGKAVALLIYYNIIDDDNIINNIKFHYRNIYKDNMIIILYLLRIYKPNILILLYNDRLIKHHFNNESILNLLIYDTLVPHSLDYLTNQHH